MGFRWKLTHALVAATMVACVASPLTALGAEVFAIRQVTANTADDGFAPVSLSGNRIVWVADAGSDGGTDTEVFTWTPTGGTVQVTANEDFDTGAIACANRVVWVSKGGPAPSTDFEIFTWTPTGGTVQVTTNGLADTDPAASGDRIVWTCAEASDDEVYTWTPTSGMIKITSNSADDYLPAVSGDRIVWFRFDLNKMNASGLLSWTPAGGVTALPVLGWCRSIGVSGDRAVCLAHSLTDPNPQEQILAWTPAGGRVQVPAYGVDDRAPVVSGDRVAWFGTGSPAPSTDFEIFTWTSATGRVRITTNGLDEAAPAISGNRIVWYGDDGTNDEVFTWTPTAGITEVTTNPNADADPAVSGNRIAWYGVGGSDAGADYEVFTAVPKTPVSYLSKPAPRTMKAPYPVVTSSTLTRYKTYKWAGYIKPKHPDGGKAVYISIGKYDYANKRFLSGIKKYTAVNVRYSSYTRYEANFPLAPGRYKLTPVADEDADHTRTVGAAAYVTVK